MMTVSPAPVSAVVDVGIPAHGRPRYIRAAIESVLGQTLSDWRLTVSEDGPGGGEIASLVEPYRKDPRVHYAATGVQVGAPRNMTSLLDRGTAPFGSLLHDDWRPDFLRRHVAFLEDHPECGFVFSRHDDMDEEGRLVGEPAFVLAEGVHQPAEFVPRQLRRNLVGGGAVVLRRSAYRDCGGFDPQFNWIFDQELWLRLGIRYPVGYLRVREAGYRLHDGQMSRRQHGLAWDCLRYIDHADALLATQAPELRLGSAERARMRAHGLLSAALDALESGERRRVRQLLFRAIATSPRGAIDRRAVGLLAGLLTGEVGRRAVGAARVRVGRHGLHAWRRPGDG